MADGLRNGRKEQVEGDVIKLVLIVTSFRDASQPASDLPLVWTLRRSAPLRFVFMDIVPLVDENITLFMFMYMDAEQQYYGDLSCFDCLLNLFFFLTRLVFFFLGMYVREIFTSSRYRLLEISTLYISVFLL